jgi:hypothetical protein
VSARSLNSILSELDPKNIDLLSIDVEGYEIEVLNGVNLIKYRPRYILVETNIYNEKEIITLLKKSKYTKIDDITKFSLKNNPLWDEIHNDYLFKES